MRSAESLSSDKLSDAHAFVRHQASRNCVYPFLIARVHPCGIRMRTNLCSAVTFCLHYLVFKLETLELLLEDYWKEKKNASASDNCIVVIVIH